MNKPTVQQIAKTLGVTESQVRSGFLRNAVQLKEMASKAERTGKKVNGFTAEQLRGFEATALQCAS